MPAGNLSDWAGVFNQGTHPVRRPLAVVMRWPMNKSHKLEAFAANAEETARREQIIQKEVDRKDKLAGAKSKTTEPMQAGPPPDPDSFPQQHLVQPGLESELHVQPMYQAPHYRRSG